MNDLRSITLNEGAQSVCELPLLSGTIGPDVIDVQTLYKQTGLFTYDPGFTSTASCSSTITYIDGDAGILLYRGYPIEQLAEHCTFLEVSYLLLNGELPDKAQMQEFEGTITIHTMVHDQLTNFFKGFRRDAHPMAIMVAVVGALSAFYHDALDIKSKKHREMCAIRLIAKVPTIVAMCHRYSTGLPFMYPQNKLSYVENFMRMMLATPCDDYVPNPILVRALERILILHADHEQNASTSTVRLAGSSGANPYACITAGITCLWGAAHGGANEAVLNMLNQIGDASRIPEFIQKAKDKNDPFRLMGFGHRVYKNFDPRARIIKKACDDILEKLGIDDEVLEIAKKLEEHALKDPYFIERKLYPNVDFYSGIIYRALGFPTDMFTVLFALGRLPGWIAQWKEMKEHKEPIGRPRQIFVGATDRDYVDISSR